MLEYIISTEESWKASQYIVTSYNTSRNIEGL